MPDRNALLLINQASRGGATAIDDGIEKLQHNGIAVRACYPGSPDEMDTLIRQYRGEIDRIIIAGGDGTISAVAASLYETGLPFGILPMGTANDLARTLDIPTDIHAAVDIIIAGRQRVIDLGEVNGILFFNAASIGLGTRVTRKLSKDIKGRWGILSYARSAWEAFKTNRSFRAKIIYDGVTLNIRSIQIAVGNGRYYGGGMVISEDAAINDKQLDVYSIKPQKFWKLMSLAPAFRSGQLQCQPYVDVVRGREIAIHTRRNKSVSTDGELTTRTPARFRVIPDALQVFAP